MDQPRWYRQPEMIGIVAIIVALVMVLTCTGCNGRGVRVAVGFMGAEVSVDIGGQIPPHASVTTTPAEPPPIDAAPPAPLEDPKDGEGVTPEPGEVR